MGVYVCTWTVFVKLLFCILVTKTQLEGTSPQVDNSDGGVRGKFGGSSGKLNGFLLAKRAGVFAREASGGGVEVAREASGVCEG